MDEGVRLVQALAADRTAIQAMARFYVYDISEYTGWPCPADGLYECFDLSPYWSEPGAHVFIIESGGERAGFAMVDRERMFSETDFNVGEFFVLRKFKGRGVGRLAATTLFDRFPGKWEVKQLPNNRGAIAFWRKVIGAYSAGNFADAPHFVPQLGYEMNVMTFTSKGPASHSAPARV